jgi:hypothetical protein
MVIALVLVLSVFALAVALARFVLRQDNGPAESCR